MPDLERDVAASPEPPKARQATRKPTDIAAGAGTARTAETANSIVGSSSHWGVLSFPQRRKPVLLLVDDNQLKLDLLRTFVTRKSYGAEIVKTAVGGREAVDAFNRYDPDIVFMDLSMPILWT